MRFKTLPAAVASGLLITTLACSKINDVPRTRPALKNCLTSPCSNADILALLKSYPKIQSPGSDLRAWYQLYLAKHYLETGKTQSAIKAAARISSQHAPWPDAALLLAHIKSEKPPEALPETLVKLQRQDLLPKYRLQEALSQERLGKTALAFSLYQKLRRDFPTREEARRAKQRVKRLRAWHTLNKPDRLEEIRLLILEQDYKRAEALALKGTGNLRDLEDEQLLMVLLGAYKGRKPEQYDIVLGKLLQSRSKGSKGSAGLLLARKQWNADNTTAALKTLRALTRTQAGTSIASEAYYLIGRIYEEQHKLKNAISAYGRIEQGSAFYPDALRQRAWIAYRDGRSTVAKTLFRELANLSFENAHTRQLATEGLFWSARLYQDGPAAEKLQQQAAYSDYAILQNASPLLQVKRQTTDCPTALTPAGKEKLQAFRFLRTHGLEAIGRHQIHFDWYRETNGRFSLEAELERLRKLQTVGAYTSTLRFAYKAAGRLSTHEQNAACISELTEYLYPRPYRETFQRASKRFAVPLSLLYAITRTESAFDPFARSPKDAFGLMQLIHATAKAEGLTDTESLYTPETNIRLGAKHLSRLQGRYSSKAQAIAAYNAGSDAVNRWILRYPELQELIWAEHLGYRETKDYVRKVLAARKIYARLERKEEH